MEQPILDLKNISLSYHSIEGETAALSHITFQVKKGEFLAIAGPSGCGKSTILNLIAGLLKPEDGEILSYPLNPSEKGLNIGYMLQKDHLFEWRTIYRNVVLGLEIQGKLTPQKEDMVHLLLDTYGLGPFKDAKPSQLSGGMRQRAALVRTLALDPDLLLLDEPFSALDYQTRLHVSDDIGGIIRKEKKTAILVTHDISEAISMSDRIVILSKRPATVQKILPINFDMESRSPLKVRNSGEFKNYFNLVWNELNK